MENWKYLLKDKLEQINLEKSQVIKCIDNIIKEINEVFKTSNQYLKAYHSKETIILPYLQIKYKVHEDRVEFHKIDLRREKIGDKFTNCYVECRNTKNEYAHIFNTGKHINLYYNANDGFATLKSICFKDFDLHSALDETLEYLMVKQLASKEYKEYELSKLAINK